jgi:hypothetical protein
MSYESEVLADNPLFYGRLDELSGTVITDISGNGNHGTYFPEAVLGEDSPIETDASSRAVRRRVGTVPNVDPRVTWTDEVWILYSEDLLVGTGTGLCRGGQVGLSASNFVMVDGGHARTQISTTGGSYNLSWPLPDFGWYHMVSGRLGSLAVLYVNGFLRAATTDVDSGDRAGFGIPSDVYHIGVPTTTNFWEGAGTDEPAIYDYLLSADRVLAHYLAALLNPPVFLRGDLHFNCYITGFGEPTPQLLPFVPNWENPIKETLEWLTDVIPSRQDYEQRAAVRMRPRRSLEYDFSFLDDRERRLFRAFLFANQQRTIFIPIATDEVRLTADADAGATELEFESTNFDFNDGGHLALFENEDTNEVIQIDEAGETSTTLAAPTTLDHAIATARVFPVARAIAPSAIQINRLTDSMEDASIAFRILVEDVPLAPHRLGSYTPRYTYNDIEVFDPFILGPNNWNEDGKGEVATRAADPESIAGVFSRTAQDTFPRELTSYSFFLDGRDEISRFLVWWWNMEGRTKPIWVPTMSADFSVLSANSIPASVTVADHDQTDFYKIHEARRDLAFCYTNETMTFRRIGSAEASGPNDILFLAGSTVSLTSLWFTSFLKLSRLNEDTITLVWYTDQLVEVSLNFIDEKPTDDQ